MARREDAVPTCIHMSYSAAVTCFPQLCDVRDPKRKVALKIENKRRFSDEDSADR